jgi:hypothetical protein
VGALFLVGIVSGPVGWAALGIIMNVGLVVGGLSLLTAVIVGKVQQEVSIGSTIDYIPLETTIAKVDYRPVLQKLKDTIDGLVRARFDAKVQYNRLMLLITWMDDFGEKAPALSPPLGLDRRELMTLALCS